MKTKVNLSLDAEVAASLKKLAEEEHKPVSQWVSDAVLKAMKENEKSKRSDKN